MLTLVPTPVGNLKDITLRALEVLREADIVLAEDTRKTGQLLAHFEIKTQMESFHAHNEHTRVAWVVERLGQGKKMALCTDAGTPGISDPGFLLVRACVEAGLEVDCLPGATAFVPALVMSGLPADRFIFEGFLPIKGKVGRLQKLAEEPRTLIFYESPHRIGRTLTLMAEHLGPDRKIVICREISKLYQENIRHTLGEAALTIKDESIRGELVLVVQGAV
jgi:16S rRNA (cytidine1402-2'-O)-methyltransferase